MEQKEDITKLGYYLNRAFAGIVEALDHAFRENGVPLNHAQFCILKVLERNKASVMSQRAIAMSLGKDPAAISRTLKILESNGMIERHAVSGCKNGVLLSEKYHTLRSRIEETIHRVTHEYCTGLTEEEITHGLVFLKKIIERQN